MEPWIPWSGAGDPSVTLVFRKSPTEYYRVKKVFGTNTALLERSSDGAGWTSMARARDVEAQLRSLLQWGIPDPGGNKAPKGLPESFLATALLAEQDHVTNIFEQDLARDGADSGRVQVRAALQAMAQDPLFKSVLDTAQARLDEAYTPTGQPRRSAGSPFKRISDVIKAHQQEREDAARVASGSRQLAEQLSKLQNEVVASETDVQEKAQQRENLEQRYTRQKALATATAARNDAQSRIDAVTEADKNLKLAEKRVSEFEPKIPEIRKAEEEAGRIYEAATADATLARERCKGELAQQEAAILRDREELRKRQERLNLALDLRKAEELSKEASNLEANQKRLSSEIATLEAVEPWMSLQSARSSLDAANARIQKITDLKAKAASLREQASKEWPSQQSRELPDANRLKLLQSLHRNLEICEAKLDVGLSVSVRGAPKVVVSVDGAAKESKTSPFDVEAKKFTELEFGDGIKVLVQGGRATDRREADRLRKEWQEATALLFATLNVVDLAALIGLCHQDAEKKARADTLKHQAETADAERTAFGDPSVEMQQLTTRIKEIEKRLDGADFERIQSAAKAHSANIANVLAKKRAEQGAIESKIANFRAQEATLRRSSLQSDVILDIETETNLLKKASDDVAQREKKIADGRKIIDAPQDKNDALQLAVANAKKALNDAQTRLESAKHDRATWIARLEERCRDTANIDILALTKAEDSARTATSNDGEPVEEAQISNARKSEQAARNHHENRVRELQKAEGALLASGGAAADERVQELDAALQRTQEKQASLEDEYAAWRLLAETLKEAERTQATHLGNVLAPELTAQLRGLAGQRYSGVALSPHLGLEGIEVAGGRRELDRLSIGTREQLSTLFRLCLAERLRSALLLDDQLVQSDPERLRWFRRVLRETAQKGIQIIVLTCRPDDYLEPTEVVPPHVVDLKDRTAR
jgi:DNA repair exonuclease SbcCD ATPase subunit